MKNWLLPSSLVALALVLGPNGTGAPATAAAPLLVPCPNTLPHEPIVVFDIVGSTIAGPYDRQLVVYGDGAARLSTTNAHNGEGKSRLVNVTQGTAMNLLATLSANGAFELCDDTGMATDLPLSTLTVMRPGTSVRTHTYSWWAGVGPYAPPEQTLLAFVASAFPGF